VIGAFISSLMTHHSSLAFSLMPMSEIMDEEINVAGLMAEIRAEAGRRKAAGEVLSIAALPPAPRPASSNGAYTVAQADAPAELPRISLRDDLQLRIDASYTLDELLKYYDAEFVENAYRAILKREPEQSGYATYLESLRNGSFDRVDVLVSLRYSSEGRERGVFIKGLKGRALLRRLYGLPVLGYLIECLVRVWRLPLLASQERRFQGYYHAQQEQTVAHVNQTVAHINQLSEQLDRIHASVYEQFRRLDDELKRLANEEMKQLAEADAERAETISKQFQAGLQSVAEQFRGTTQVLGEQMQAQSIQFSQHAEQFAQRLQATRAALVMQERRTLRLLEETGQPSSTTPSPARQAAEAAEEQHRLSDAFYAAFEEHFRGSREEIMKRLRVYLPVLRGAKVTAGVLDVGSGRGEWLEVLKQEGIEARGIDTNRVQVEACRARGLEVTHADALAFLRGLPDNQLSAVTAFHVIEHLEFERLVALMDEIMRVLVPGGLCIFETPNPENVSVTGHNFYVDPTHRNPLPIPMMKFLFESRGFCKTEVMRLHPSDTPRVEGDTDLVARFNDYFYGAMDYAIFGSKA
jgi:SAM-dependent methyltransferase